MANAAADDYSAEAVDPGILAILCRAGLAGPNDRPAATRLTGGVSSDIWRVQLPGGPVCVKRALARLAVAADWRAPIERSRFEAAWLREVAGILPAAAPALLHEDLTAPALVMRFLDPGQHRLWKHELMVGRVDRDAAAELGQRLAAIHGATAGRVDVARRFASDAIFRSIRIEPYLLATAQAHPALELPLGRLARRLAATRLALVHGDVSPKNTLIGPAGPVLLDAECAWYGDPAFDLAFVLNHLLLKCVWRRAAARELLAAFDALAGAYLDAVSWEPRRRLEGRAAALLPALMLARIDGKSPVEYITSTAQQDLVRGFATARVASAPARLGAVRGDWARTMEGGR